MVAPQYDFAEFIDEIKNLPLREMLAITEMTFIRAEDQIRGGEGFRDRQRSLAFKEAVGEFLLFLKTGVKPSSVSEFNWPLYRTPVANLVQRWQMKRSVLLLF